jgi:anti-sigma regulatory factor (Ser/Thr protein kinase)
VIERRPIEIYGHPADFPERRVERPLGLQSLQEGDLHIELPMSIEAPALARAAVIGWAQDVELDSAREDALRLLVSEAVSNAVRHSGARPDLPIRLAASFVEGEVMVTVTDAGTTAFPHMREPDPLDGGYGLHLIAEEATRWGAGHTEGTRVWFCL